MGLYLLTAPAAYDFGYIGLLNLSLRLNSTFDTLAKLERYRGHFLNWIDTSSLHHLSPRYVSTVDSGNLAGCLLALKQACLSMQDELVWRPIRWQGLLDTLSLYYEGVEIKQLPQCPTGKRSDIPYPSRYSKSVRNVIRNMLPP